MEYATTKIYQDFGMTKLAKYIFFCIIHLVQSGPERKKVEEENPLT